MTGRSLRSVIRYCAVRVLGEARVRAAAARARKSIAVLRERRHQPPPIRFVPMARLTTRRVTREGLMARRPTSVSIHEFLPAEDHAVNSLRVPTGPDAGSPVPLYPAPQRYRSD